MKKRQILNAFSFVGVLILVSGLVLALRGNPFWTVAAFTGIVFAIQKPVYLSIKRHTAIKRWLREKLSDSVFARQY